MGRVRSADGIDRHCWRTMFLVCPWAHTTRVGGRIPFARYVSSVKQSNQAGSPGKLKKSPGAHTSRHTAAAAQAQQKPSGNKSKSAAKRASKVKDITDMSLVFLGTSSSEPTRTRNVTGLALKMGGKSWLFDCGEGTQRQICSAAGFTTPSIERIFVTHMHGDHVFGLPGLLCNIVHNRDNDSEHSPIAICGPPGLRRYIHEALRLTTASVPDHVVTELHSNATTVGHDDDLLPDAQTGHWKVHSDRVCEVWAGRIIHQVDCWGYALHELPIQTIDLAKAIQLGVPAGPLLGQLQQGHSVKIKGGITVRIGDVSTQTRPGRKVVILGDTCNPRNVTELARGCDVLVHESTYDDCFQKVALDRGHSTATMAGEFAFKVEAEQLILTHFSSRYRGQEAIQLMIGQAQKAFKSKRVMAADDFLEIVVPRKDLISCIN